MIAFYVKRIKNGLMNIEDVPVKWRDAVSKML